jgi:hypothetical protein
MTIKNVTGKEAKDIFVHYFKKESLDDVADIAASFLISLHMFMNVEKLTKEQRDNLLDETRITVEKANDFIRSYFNKEEVHTFYEN